MTTGTVLPWDGTSVGEIEVRGPWITGSYYRAPTPEKFDDGWLRTGDIGTIDDRGFFQITDRAKDVIKSGGEWISSVELENLLIGNPDVLEAAVIGIPDEQVDRATARLRRVAGGPRRCAGRPRPVAGRQRCRVADAGELGLRRGGPEDLGRQVRQEGTARGVSGGRAEDRTDAMIGLPDSVIASTVRVTTRSSAAEGRHTWMTAPRGDASSVI